MMNSGEIDKDLSVGKLYPLGEKNIRYSGGWIFFGADRFGKPTPMMSNG
jgi:hypothetical protein